MSKEVENLKKLLEDQVKRRRMLERENELLREGLAFYADVNSWNYYGNKGNRALIKTVDREQYEDGKFGGRWARIKLKEVNKTYFKGELQ